MLDIICFLSVFIVFLTKDLVTKNGKLLLVYFQIVRCAFRSRFNSVIENRVTSMLVTDVGDQMCW